MSVIRRRAVVFIICLLALIVWWFLIPREPAYQGKSLSTWLRDFDFRSQQGAAARAAVRAIGTNSLPTLIGYLTHRDKPFKLRFVAFARQHGYLGHFVRRRFSLAPTRGAGVRRAGVSSRTRTAGLSRGRDKFASPGAGRGGPFKDAPKKHGRPREHRADVQVKAACDKAMVSLADACSYPEVAALSIAGLSNALQRFDTAIGGIVALAGLRDGNYSSEIREAAARALETFQPTPQYPPIQTPSERAWRRRFSVPAD